MTTPKVLLLKRPAKLGGKRVYYWTLRWKDSTGRDKYQSLGRVGKITASAAKTAQRQKMLDFETGKASSKPKTKMLLSEFINFHEVHFSQGIRPTTIVEWKIAGNHAVKALGDKPIADITWTDGGELRAYLEGKKKSPATIRKTLSTLKAMLGRAAKRGLIHENPFADEQLGPPIKRPKRIFSQLELDAMVEVTTEVWWKAAITLAYTSGLRRGELLHLRWTDFDATAGTVRVEEHHAHRYIADGGIDIPILAWIPKTKKSTRTLPIPPQTVLMLLRLQRLSDGPYIFLNVKRLQVIDAKAKAGKLRADFDLINNFSREYKKIQLAAKKLLELKNWQHGCFHDLRKTFGTRAATNGVPMHELQAHMGHSSITTTAEYYCEVEQSAAERLRAVFAEVA